MTNYLDNQRTHIDEFDLQLYTNAREALIRAMAHYRDGDLSNYFIIVVEGYKCIAHTSDEFEPLVLDKIIFPFDDEKLYPMQGLKTVYEFELNYIED